MRRAQVAPGDAAGRKAMRAADGAYTRRAVHSRHLVLGACLLWAGCGGAGQEASAPPQVAMGAQVSGEEVLALPEGEVQALALTEEGQTLSALLEGESSATGGIELEPNTIRGRVRFTNTNPEILALLDSDPRKFAYVGATSTRPTGYSATALPDAANMRGFDFEMQVEAAAGGPQGVTYRLEPRWSHIRSRENSFFVYRFQPVSVQVRPRSQQPEPTEVDVAECVGVVRLQFGTDETCSTPVPVSNLYFLGGYVSMPSSSTHHVYLRAGSSGTSLLRYLVGGVSRWHNLSWNASCDEVATQCVVVPSGEDLGGLTGPWQLVGEQARSERFLAAHGGPGGAYRTVSSRTELEAPVSEPSRWWSLPDMPPGTYGSTYGRGGLRLGRQYTWFLTQFIQAQVLPAQTSALTQRVDGELRYPFVMRPAFQYGSIRLADPYVPAHSGARSSLETLFFDADQDRDRNGVPDFSRYFQGTRYTASLRTPQAASASVGFSATSFPGGFDSASGELASQYELPLLSAYDLPLSWQPSLLRLGFSSEGYALSSLPITRPGQYDPARFRYGYLDFMQRQAASTLAPGQSRRVDHEYCLSEVQLEYSTEDSRFYNPTATVQGRFTGQDWMRRAADYSVQGRAWGIPSALGIPQGEAITYAATQGSVSFALPQGSYSVTPGATLVNAEGQVNEATFQPLGLTVGCGQRLKLVPPLAISLEGQQLCASSPSMTVTGRVRSSPAEVDRVWYVRPDGQEVTLCTGCGIDPTFSFPVELSACDNDIQVYAFTEGMPQPAMGQARVVWDDPSDGPSCPGAQCVNHAPVARCRNVTVTADTGCASVDDGSYDPDEGDSFSCVQSAACPLPLGTHRVTLTCTDSGGLSSSCEASVTVKDLTPPTIACPSPEPLECVEGAALASFAPVASDDQGAVSVVCAPASNASFPLGTTLTTCTATDSAGNRASCAFPVTVRDSLAPQVSPLPGPSVLECAGAPYVDPGATALDLCGGDLSASILSTSTLDLSRAGSYSVRYTVTDAAGHVGSAERPLQVVDSRPPVVQTSTVQLWPPNHQLRAFTLSDCARVSDVCDSSLSLDSNATLVSISSDEPEDARGGGDGHTRGDIVLTGPSSFQLRAERQGAGNGRVYQVRFTVRDASGNPTPGTCSFHVPRDRSGAPATEDGANGGYTLPAP